jgi:hypothetical protein
MLSAILRTARFFKTPATALTWSAEFIDDRITTPRHKNHLDFYASRQLSIADGVAEVLGTDLEMINHELKHLPEFLGSKNKDPGMTIKWSATSELAATTYALVKILKPDVMVETGVGAGVSSWTILQAMEETGNGRLISIDLPTPNTQLLPEVGYLVPHELRGRWELRTGPSRQLLPRILKELGNVGIFQHDSRHSYSNQLREYQTAWPFIQPGGMLISDDVSNDALHDATRIWKREPTIIGQSKSSPIGLVRKA